MLPVPFRFRSARNHSAIYRSSTHTHSCDNRRNDPAYAWSRTQPEPTGTPAYVRAVLLGLGRSRRRRPWQQNVDAGSVDGLTNRTGGGVECARWTRTGGGGGAACDMPACGPAGHRCSCVVTARASGWGWKRRARAVPRHRRAITGATARSASTNHLIANTHAVLAAAAWFVLIGWVGLVYGNSALSTDT